jgi:hypothetical protein
MSIKDYLNQHLDELPDNVYEELSKLPKDSSDEEYKAVLNAHIDELSDDLYNTLQSIKTKNYIAEFNAINPDKEAQTQFAKINELAKKGNADAKRFIEESSATGYTRPQSGELDLGGYLGKFQEQQHSQMFDETALKLSQNLNIDLENAKSVLGSNPRAMQLIAENGLPDTIKGWANLGIMLGLDEFSGLGRMATSAYQQAENLVTGEGKLGFDQFRKDQARTQGFENQGIQSELMSPTLPISMAMGGPLTKLGGKVVSRMLPTTTTKAIGEGIGGTLMAGFEQLGQAGTALAENSALGGKGLHRTQAPPTMKETALMMLTGGALGSAMPYAKKGFDSFVKPMFKAKPQVQMTQAMPNQSNFAQTTQAIPTQTTPMTQGATQIPQQATSQNILNDIEFGADLTQNEIHTKLDELAPQIPYNERRMLGQKIHENSANLQGLSDEGVNIMRNKSIADALHTTADAQNVLKYESAIMKKPNYASTSIMDDFVTQHRPKAKQALKKEANEIGSKIGEFRSQVGLPQTTSKEDVLTSWNDALEGGVGLRVELSEDGVPFLVDAEKGSMLNLGSTEEGQVMAMTKDILKRTKSGEMTEDQLQTTISMLRGLVPYQKARGSEDYIDKTISKFRSSLKDKAILNFENKMRDNGIDEDEIANRVKEYNDNLKAFAINKETDKNFDKVLGNISTTLDEAGNEQDISAKGGTAMLRQIGRSGTETSRALSEIFQKHLGINLPKEVTHMKIASDLAGGSASQKMGVSGFSISNPMGAVTKFLTPKEKERALMEVIAKRLAQDRKVTKGINLEGKK